MQKFLLAAVAFALTGCAFNPPYQFAADEKKASLKLYGMGTTSMCRAGKFYNLAPAENNTVSIPVGERVSLGTYMYFDSYPVTYSCHPFLSFLPKAGESYVLDNMVRNGKCFVELAREDKTKATGVVLETSVGPRDCYK